MNHYKINKKEAELYGINSALVLTTIEDLLKLNLKKENNIRDGKVWVFITMNELSDEIEIFTRRQIRTALKKLLESGILLKGDYSRNKFDATACYTVDKNEFRGYESN